ncbi:CCND1 protein, partial [Nothoprocta pentlandii]|nr:CCND1 protein [Nothoprocta pentlandii]
MEHQLLCCEVETIRRAHLDANLLTDRVLQTMLKAEETCAPSVSYFKCVQREILPYMRKMVATWMLEQMELLLVNKLKWNLAAMTPHDFIEHFLTKMPLAEDTKQIIRKHAQTFVALCATDVKFISNPPSMIAAGSVVAAVQGLHLGDTNTFLSYQCLTHFLSQVIKCDPDCLRACQEQIESLLESSLRQAQQHNVSSETKTVEDEADLSCTPTDVRDVNI